MVAKTIMKRIAIAVLSAVILNGVTPLDSLNVYASENTGASYTALDLYTYLQDQCTTEYTLTEKAETFLEEHDDFFPASPELAIPDEMTDAELDFAKDISEKAGLMNNGKYFAGLYPLEDTPVPLSIGTDASQVSHTVPLITISAATMCHGTALHHWAAREQAGMSIGHKGMLYAARCMAEGTKLLLSKPEYLQAVWDYHNVPQD